MAAPDDERSGGGHSQPERVSLKAAKFEERTRVRIDRERWMREGRGHFRRGLSLRHGEPHKLGAETMHSSER